MDSRKITNCTLNNSNSWRTASYIKWLFSIDCRKQLPFSKWKLILTLSKYDVWFHTNHNEIVCFSYCHKNHGASKCICVIPWIIYHDFNIVHNNLPIKLSPIPYLRWDDKIDSGNQYVDPSLLQNRLRRITKCRVLEANISHDAYMNND